VARSNGPEADWQFEVGEQEINGRRRSNAYGTLKTVVILEGDLAGRNDFHSSLIDFRENIEEGKHQSMKVMITQTKVIDDGHADRRQEEAKVVSVDGVPFVRR
jgi:hypothetical protein